MRRPKPLISLGALHDLGKAAVLFQNKILYALPEVRERIGAVLDLTPPAIPHTAPHARASEAILLELGCPAGWPPSPARTTESRRKTI